MSHAHYIVHVQQRVCKEPIKSTLRNEQYYVSTQGQASILVSTEEPIVLANSMTSVLTPRRETGSSHVIVCYCYKSLPAVPTQSDQTGEYLGHKTYPRAPSRELECVCRQVRNPLPTAKD